MVFRRRRHDRPAPRHRRPRQHADQPPGPRAPQPSLPSALDNLRVEIVTRYMALDAEVEYDPTSAARYRLVTWRRDGSGMRYLVAWSVVRRSYLWWVDERPGRYIGDLDQAHIAVARVHHILT